MSHRPQDLEARLVALIRSSPVLMRALRTARTINPPDWLVGAGAVRDCVWAHLHGLAQPVPRDLDLAFYDPNSLDPSRERELERDLSALAPDLPWEATNQAAVHLWYPHVHGVEVRRLTCSADGVASWPETATAVGVRLRPDDAVEVIAPFGLDDLFGLLWRHNRRRATVAYYRERIESKQIARRWPLVQVLDPSG